jgi:hypothetical protein
MDKRMGMAGVWGILELFREFYSEMVLYVVFVVGRSYDEYTAEIATSFSSSPSYRLCIFSLSRPFLSTHLLSFWMLVFSFSFYQSYPLPLPSLLSLISSPLSFPSPPLLFISYRHAAPSSTATEDKLFPTPISS